MFDRPGSAEGKTLGNCSMAIGRLMAITDNGVILGRLRQDAGWPLLSSAVRDLRSSLLGHEAPLADLIGIPSAIDSPTDPLERDATRSRSARRERAR